jgi:hypothetical protein
LLDARCKDLKDTLISKTKESAKYPSYTADLWKSQAKQYYLSVAIHYIDNDWVLHHPLICCTHVNDSHTKDVIGKLIADQLKPFLGEGAKVHSGVTDGGELASIKHTEKELVNTNNVNFEKKVPPSPLSSPLPPLPLPSLFSSFSFPFSHTTR